MIGVSLVDCNVATSFLFWGFMVFVKGEPSTTKGKKMGRHPNWDAKYPLEEVMVVNSTYARHRLKKRILDNDLIPYVCDVCSKGFARSDGLKVHQKKIHHYRN